jgi:tetratricopeptide (TPR) repeat protein
MQAFARRVECKHIVWAGPLADTAATLQVADEVRGRSCPTCGEVVGRVDIMVFKEPESTFDASPAPRNTGNKLRKSSPADAERTRRHLTALGAETDGLAADLKQASLELTPAHWRSTLTRIPVGLMPARVPNAACIRFKGSPVPAIVFHQGLAGFLFKMNRSIFPLLRMGSLSGHNFALVKDQKTRTALQVQAVDTALEFLGVGRPRSKVLVEIPSLARMLEMPITRTMSAFLLCHEYGHAVLNHADELTAAGEFFLLERSRAMEHEADAWGQDAVIGAFTAGRKLEQTLDMLDDLFGPQGGGDMKRDIAHAAPCIALLYFEFLDTIEERIGRARRPAAGGTHPSNQDRFRALYAHLSKHGNFSAHTWVEAFELMLNEIKNDLDRLIDKTGAVPGRRFSRRFRWRPKRRADTWRNDYSTLDGDDKKRRRLEARLQEAERNSTELRLDEAGLWQRFERLKSEAEKHYDKKEYAEAERIYRQILEGGETLETVPLYPMLGCCRERLGDIDGAVAAHRRCLELVPGSDFAAMSGYFLGALLVDRGDLEGAVPPLTAALTSHVPEMRRQARSWLDAIEQHRTG